MGALQSKLRPTNGDLKIIEPHPEPQPSSAERCERCHRLFFPDDKKGKMRIGRGDWGRCGKYHPGKLQTLGDYLDKNLASELDPAYTDDRDLNALVWTCCLASKEYGIGLLPDGNAGVQFWLRGLSANSGYHYFQEGCAKSGERHVLPQW